MFQEQSSLTFPGLDVGAGGSCCGNENYCIVANGTPSCCHIAGTCGNLCDANHYECPGTTTLSGTTISSTCCPRSCTATSQYLCASAYGGQCCNYDQGCASNSQCIATSTSSSIASNTGTATGTGPTGSSSASSSSSSGLSIGAKAGVGAGVAVGALVVVSGFLWFCLAHRRRAKRAAAVPAMSQGSDSGAKRPSGGRSGSDYFGPAAAVGPFTEHHDSTATSPGARSGVPVSPQSPGDIAIPVEIDSNQSRGHSNVTTPGAFEFKKGSGTTEEPVELP